MSDDTDAAVPIGQTPTGDPYDAEFGGWTPAQLRQLVELVCGLHSAVWPHREVDGDGDPASILLEHAEATRRQVVELRSLAQEVVDGHVTQKACDILDALEDHDVVRTSVACRDLPA